MVSCTIHVRVCVRVCTCVYMCVHVCTCVYVCVRVCIDSYLLCGIGLGLGLFASLLMGARRLEQGEALRCGFL